MFAHVLLVVSSPFVGGVDAPTGVEQAPVAVAPVAPTSSPDDPPPPTINEFIPEDRAIGDCISALPKPGCGSEARGGWRQGAILIAILGGLGFIGWRVVRTARRARADAESATAP